MPAEPEAPAPAADVTPTQEEWAAAASCETPLSGVWACVGAQQRMELVLDVQSSVALLVRDRTDGVMGTWAGTPDGSGVVDFEGTTCSMQVSGDVLTLSYDGQTYQFVRSAW